MRCKHGTLLLMLSAPLSPAVGQSVPIDGLPTQVRELFDALAHGDTARIRPRLASDLTWVVGANGVRVGRALLLEVASRPQVPTPRFEIDSLQIRPLGNVALVQFRRIDRRQIGRGESATRSRVSEIYVSEGGRWQLAHHTQTWLVTPVTSLSTDSALVKAFVGRYQIAPGYVDDVRWVGDHLVATATGQQSGARLVPVSESVFSPDGVGALIAFERDNTGRVVGYVQGFPDGTVFRAPKLP